MQAKGKIVWYCVPSSEHLYFIWYPDDEKSPGSQVAKQTWSPKWLHVPFNWTTHFASRNQALIAPLCQSTTPTPLYFLLSKCNVCEERKELVHLGDLALKRDAWSRWECFSWLDKSNKAKDMAALFHFYDLGNKTYRLLTVRKNCSFIEQGKTRLPQHRLGTTEVDSKWKCTP